jgi:hypothetical protein
MLAALLACTPATVAFKNGGDTADTAGDAKKETGTDSAVGDTDTGDTAAPFVPTTDFGSFTGTRHYFADYTVYHCDETVVDDGTALAEDDPMYTLLGEECGACDHFFEVTVSNTAPCDYVTLSDPSWRGLILGDDWAIVYLWGLGDNGGLEAKGQDDGATWDGETTVTFTVDYELLYGLGTLAMDGEMDFPLTTE